MVMMLRGNLLVTCAADILLRLQRGQGVRRRGWDLQPGKLQRPATLRVFMCHGRGLLFQLLCRKDANVYRQNMLHFRRRRLSGRLRLRPGLLPAIRQWELLRLSLAQRHSARLCGRQDLHRGYQLRRPHSRVHLWRMPDRQEVL